MSETIGYTLIQIDQTESTNNYATSQLRENEVRDRTVFLTYNQTNGRGQKNNKWESEPKMNLTFSILVKPTFLEITKQFMLSKVVCLAMDALLSEFVGDVKIKWPNDIYIGNKKICGILIENSIMGGQINQSVIGIGLNINQDLFVTDAPNPVSLKQLTGSEYDLEEILIKYLNYFENFYQKLIAGLYDEIDELFRMKLYQLNDYHLYKDKEHEYSGMIIGVNEIGQLRIQEKTGAVHEYHFKEVEYVKNT